jgi:hypothetical protein
LQSKSQFHCGACRFRIDASVDRKTWPLVNEKVELSYCTKRHHELPNGYAMAAHSSKCGEKLTDDEERTLVVMGLIVAKVKADRVFVSKNEEAKR